MPIPLPLLPLIAETVYYSSRPAMDLDPVPEPGRWTEQDARHTLYALSRVNRDWHDEAGKFLWRRLHFRLAGGFLSVVDVVAGKQVEQLRQQSDEIIRLSSPPPDPVRPEAILPDGPTLPRPYRQSSLRIASIPESSEDTRSAPPARPTLDTSRNAFSPPSFTNELATPVTSPLSTSPPVSSPLNVPSISSTFFAHPPITQENTPPSSRSQSPSGANSRGRRRFHEGLIRTASAHTSSRARSMSPARDMDVDEMVNATTEALKRESESITRTHSPEKRGRKFDRVRELSVEAERLRSASPVTVNLHESRHNNTIAIREPSPEREGLAEMREQSPDEHDNTLWGSNYNSTWLDPFCPVTATPYPARHINHISFTSFRTAGLRRSIAQGTEERFCTPERLERLLDVCRAVRGFGASEYMDSALSLPVLESLLLREPPAPQTHRTRLRRAYSVRDPPTQSTVDDEGASGSGSSSSNLHLNSSGASLSRAKCIPGRSLHALDLSGCVSATFFDALEAFVNKHLFARQSDAFDEQADERYPDDVRARSLAYKSTAHAHHRPPSNPHTGRYSALRRLNVSNVVNVFSPTLKTFVLAFPALTHLDLSNTRATPGLIRALARSPTLRLESFAAARCKKLDGDCLLRLLVDSPVTENLRELNLYGDSAVPSPLSVYELDVILRRAPCFISGNLRYIDLAGAPLTKEILSKLAAQPHLRSLGLANIPRLPLGAVAEFIKNKAPGCEIVDLALSTPELAVIPGVSSTVRSAVLTLQTSFIKVLTNPPFHFSLTSPSPVEQSPPPTAIRVIELGAEMLNALQGGAGSWRVIRSRGRRGWYVDVSTKPLEDGLLARKLDKSDPWRQQMESLSQARGNVASYIGWHSRKMEVLSGQGMLGREDGLYGVYAYSTGL
ncbi:hypothetical protein E3P89_03164 [Wallemia ichthyophaga]|uniref:Uncharacterized protein n=1 Tax=Wallemia ichthyophaga TaxID=245174 RepID=A0A4V4M1K6_WALIC|nr:hypothetical protein E3P93_03154 [Wallemia ichthyophaga]TIB09675.1 hypothetical protein E3P90_03185 [Wallemia ichthyophaga]TIB20493.1 hypothetical protein E3P89_03164 [Wallemia ichthyophaga]TIB22064.1 hypothetical protein E3P88_03198 [Wallemia ichthyophaga]